MGRQQDSYDPTNFVKPESGSSGYLTAEATPNAFGAKVGESIQKAGKAVEGFALEQGQIEVESKVNDDYATKYMPAAMQLRNQYDSLDGQEKVHGYEAYIKGLNQLNTQFESDAKSPLEGRMVKGLIQRHTLTETQAANRELVQAQHQFAAKSTWDFMDANVGYAAANYNDPAVVDSMQKINDAQIIKHLIDQGHDPNTPEGTAAINGAKREMTGKMAVGMVNRASSSGDVSTAYEIRNKYSTNIPADQQLHLDNQLGVQAIQQGAESAINSLIMGQPIPIVPGDVAPQTKALIADTAQKSGIDVNNMLAVCRSDIPSDDPNVVQQKCDRYKDALTTVSSTLGRDAEGWEAYTVYREPVAGAALLQADPNNRVLNVMTAAYNGDADKALAALLDQGGNAGMTVGDFTTFYKQKFEGDLGRASIRIPPKGFARNIGEAIFAQESGNNPNIGRSVDGAIGAAQIMPDTFKRFAKPGEDINNPADNRIVGQRYIDHLGKLFNNDPARIAVGYFSGEGNVAPAGSPTPWKRDHKDGNGKSVSSYVSDIFTRMGHADNGATTVLGQAPSPLPGAAIMDAHTRTVPPVQPGATPVQELANFNKRLPAFIDYIEVIPDTALREGAYKELERHRALYNLKASAYEEAFKTEALQLITNKDFKSMSQVPPTLMAGLATNPDMIKKLEEAVESNLYGGVKPNTNSPAVIFKRGEVEKLKADDPQAFMNYNFVELSGQLPGEEIKEYQKAAAEMRSGKKISASEAEQNSIVKDARTMRAITGDKEEAVFRNIFKTRIEAFTERTNKQPSWTELRDISDQIITEKAFRSGGIWEAAKSAAITVGNYIPTVRAVKAADKYFEPELSDPMQVAGIDDIPEEEQNAIIKSYRDNVVSKGRGRLSDLTDQKIVDIYKGMLSQKSLVQ